MKKKNNIPNIGDTIKAYGQLAIVDGIREEISNKKKTITILLKDSIVVPSLIYTSDSIRLEDIQEIYTK
jgi:hypothetical protein